MVLRIMKQMIILTRGASASVAVCFEAGGSWGIAAGILTVLMSGNAEFFSKTFVPEGIDDPGK